MLCPRGLKVLPDGKERERRDLAWFIVSNGRGGKDWSDNGGLPEWNWRGLCRIEGVWECWGGV